MPNKSYLDLKDELDDEPNASELEDYMMGGGDMSPYDSISDRVSPEDEEEVAETPAPAAAPPVNPVYDAILGRVSSRRPVTPWRQTPPRPYTLAEFKEDPLMQEYETTQKDLEGYRRAKLQADAMGNLGQSFAQIARGVSEPNRDWDLYRNIERQNADMLKSKSQDIERRTGVIEAIERRKTRERVAQEYANARRDVASMNQFTRQDQYGDRLLNQSIRTVDSLFKNPPINREVIKLNAARSVQALIEEIESGKLTDSKNIGKQLTNLIATIELGAPGGVADRQEMGINTLYTTAKGALTYLSGSPKSSIPRGYLNQLKTEGQALGQRALKNYEVLTNSSLAGTEGMVTELGRRRQQDFIKANQSPKEQAPAFERIQGPDGRIFKVPADQVEKAIKSGGKRVK
jgi:hypothetical protein